LFGVLVYSLFFLDSDEPVFKSLGEKTSDLDLEYAKVSLRDSNAQIIDETLTQYTAVVGKVVRWKKEFKVSGNSGFKLDLPEGSENVSVRKLDQGREEDITDSISVDKKGIFRKRVEVNVEDDSGKEYEVEFETPSPEVVEEPVIKEITFSAGKRIIITGNDNIHYQNVLSFAKLPKELEKEKESRIKLYQIIDGQRVPVGFNAYDTDENGLLDYVEWITPMLSDAEFLLIIEITKAEHLDENREFVEDIYESVKERDGNWSLIENNEYVRVKFEQKLESSNDITIYARSSNGSSDIEVYEADGNEIIDFRGSTVDDPHGYFEPGEYNLTLKVVNNQGVIYTWVFAQFS